MEDRLLVAFKTSYYDEEKEQYRLHELDIFVQTVSTIRDISVIDNAMEGLCL